MCHDVIVAKVPRHSFLRWPNKERKPRPETGLTPFHLWSTVLGRFSMMIRVDESKLIQEIDNECRWLQEQLQGRSRSLARELLYVEIGRSGSNLATRVLNGELGAVVSRPKTKPRTPKLLPFTRAGLHKSSSLDHKLITGT